MSEWVNQQWGKMGYRIELKCTGKFVHRPTYGLHVHVCTARSALFKGLSDPEPNR